MHMLNSVMNDYLNAKIKLEFLASSKTSTPSIDAVIHDLPKYFRDVISELKRDDLVVDSSIGMGRIANVPWVRISNKQISTAATEGYYIVLLFSSNMDKCYLSLNQAVTAYKKTYRGRAVNEKMLKIAKLSSTYLRNSTDSIIGKIDLGSISGLVRGYENGAIASYLFSKNDATSESTFKTQFTNLLSDYDLLFSVIGKKLEYLDVQTESNFQSESLEVAEKIKKKLIKPVVPPTSGGIKKPPKIRLNSKDVYGRNPVLAAEALIGANYRCEVEPSHLTFMSKISNENFVEAHHLIPMKFQNDFDYSLDVTENIVSLCPCCHRLLHHADAFDKKKLLELLFTKKENGLKNRAIHISLTKLIEKYN